MRLHIQSSKQIHLADLKRGKTIARNCTTVANNTKFNSYLKLAQLIGSWLIWKLLSRKF